MTTDRKNSGSNLSKLVNILRRMERRQVYVRLSPCFWKNNPDMVEVDYNHCLCNYWTNGKKQKVGQSTFNNTRWSQQAYFWPKPCTIRANLHLNNTLVFMTRPHSHLLLIFNITMIDILVTAYFDCLRFGVVNHLYWANLKIDFPRCRNSLD